VHWQQCVCSSSRTIVALLAQAHCWVRVLLAPPSGIRYRLSQPQLHRQTCMSCRSGVLSASQLDKEERERNSARQ
jgi:hypothetical protein